MMTSRVGRFGMAADPVVEAAGDRAGGWGGGEDDEDAGLMAAVCFM